MNTNDILEYSTVPNRCLDITQTCSFAEPDKSSVCGEGQDIPKCDQFNCGMAIAHLGIFVVLDVIDRRTVCVRSDMFYMRTVLIIDAKRKVQFSLLLDSRYMRCVCVLDTVVQIETVYISYV